MFSEEGNVAGNDALSNNEIRKIKLNYIQLNKRAGTSYSMKRPVVNQQVFLNKEPGH